MIKYVFGFLLAFISFSALAQKRSVVHLIRSTRSESMKINGRDVLKVFQGTFQQDYSTMRSDSAYFYPQDNAFDAFGNVNITQGDTLNIFSDKLNYNGNTKIAILTNNVKMVDKDATLTTNYLTYNTATRIGTYTGGGKVVNKDNTLTSKNGYYFAFSRDAYFRYNVVLVTPDALIKTDTLRYNTGSRIAYFYGPTDIYDTKDKKDTLYTENGLYNTITEQAFFGKKNLYRSGTKRLKGDSLFYDKKAGFGRAVKHVVFTDSEQKTTLLGDLANYYKDQERTVVTKDPYIIILTEEKDTTKSDTVPLKTTDGKTTSGKGQQVASPIKAPSLGNGMKVAAPAAPIKAPPLGTPLKSLPAPAADSLSKKSKLVKVDSLVKKDTLGKMDSLAKPKVNPKQKTKIDSVFISADTLDTQMMTFKAYKEMLEKHRRSLIRDTTVKAKSTAPKKLTEAEKKAARMLSAVPPRFKKDSLIVRPLLFGPPRPQAAAPPKLDKNGKPIPTKQGGKPGGKADADRRPEPDPADNDPAFAVRKVVLSDTARVRVVKAYHHAKLFKSDLQAKADSMFYSYSDSTLRCFVNPIIWTQGSQLSGDTITIQMHNKKLDNLTMFPSAFIVNIEEKDSTHFNQVSGKRMRGFFKDDKLDRVFVSGNAESIYFARDSGQVKEMERSLSSRMRVTFKDNSASTITNLTKPETRYGPLAKFQEDERILKGFIWKPKERPASKAAIIPSYAKKQAAKQAAEDKKNKGKPPVLKPGEKAPTDSTNNKLPALTPSTAVKDSASSKTPTAVKRDSTMVKPAKTLPSKPLTPQPKAKRDSTAKKPGVL